MPQNENDPLAVIGGALRSVVGWAVVIFTTFLAGFWIGMSIGTGKLATPDDVFAAVLLTTFGWLVFPQLALAFLVSLLVWALPLKIDSGRLRLVAACANLVAWLGVTVWVFRTMR